MSSARQIYTVSFNTAAILEFETSGIVALHQNAIFRAKEDLLLCCVHTCVNMIMLIHTMFGLQHAVSAVKGSPIEQ